VPTTRSITIGDWFSDFRVYQRVRYSRTVKVKIHQINNYLHSHRKIGPPAHHFATPIWKDILAGLSDFRSLTFVQLGDGKTCSFWLDSWSAGSSQADQFHALFSQSTRPNVDVDMGSLLTLFPDSPRLRRPKLPLCSPCSL
jgi:hypothetical protein